MKKTFLTLTLATTLPFVLTASDFTFGDLVVVRVGDGISTLANSAGPISLLELTPAASLVQTISVPSGNGGLQISGTATSEGQLVMNADGLSLTVAGYVPPFGGSGSLSGRSSANAPRGYVTIDSHGIVAPTVTLHNSSAYTGQNIRSGFVSGSGAWFAGSGTGTAQGVVYDNGASASSVQGVNSRVLGYHSGNLFYSSSSGTQGIYSYNGLPTGAATATAFLTGVTGQGTSPYDFVFSPDGNTLYVADDAIGVQKFTFNGSAWSLAYNFTDSASANKAYGLAVDFSGADPILYWTSPTDLWSATDAGSGVAGTSILSADPNYAFRGLDFAPAAAPEPSAFALLGLGATAVMIRRKKS